MGFKWEIYGIPSVLGGIDGKIPAGSRSRRIGEVSPPQNPPGRVLSMEFCRVHPRKCHESDAVGIPGSDNGAWTMASVNSAFPGEEIPGKIPPQIPTSNQGGFGAHPVGMGHGFGDGKLLPLGCLIPDFFLSWEFLIVGILDPGFFQHRELNPWLVFLLFEGY